MRLTDADICKINKWDVGTVLAADEGYGISIIKITAIGEEAILARLISHNGRKQNDVERTWTLSLREWKEQK